MAEYALFYHFNASFGAGTQTETTVYPDGTSDYSVLIDMRGVRTVNRSSAYEDRDEYQTQVFHPDDLVTPVSTDLSISYRNGAAVTQREWDGHWTRDTQLTEYDASGFRIDKHVTESSGYPAITNSVTRSDFLGRVVATVTPFSVASNFYDGASMRIQTSTRTGHPSAENLFDDLGEQVGTVVSGITNRTDVSYETVSGEVWRVASSLAGEVRSVTREQLTGLSDTLRRHTVAIGANNVTNEIAAVWDGSARTLTETQTSSLRATPLLRVEKYGRTISETSANGSRQYFFDPYGRVFYTERRPAGSSTWLSETWLGFNDFGDVEENDTFIGSGNAYTATFHAHDAFARTITATDALGHAVTNAYDALGRLVATYGASYPVTHGYDTAGRMASLSTTRDGAAWDMTRWLFDPGTGLVTNKVYADDTVLSYTYDSASRPLRTIWARGAWREHAYNETGLLTAITYNDSTPAVSLAYDAFQRLAVASNAVATYVYANDALGATTNETAAIGTNNHAIVRGYDSFHRLASLTIDDKPVHYGYDAENRLFTVSNDVFTVIYAYTPDGWDTGYTIALTNGTVLSRTVTRDPYRRGLITFITNSVDGVVINPLAYNYDLLNRATKRNADTFGYNTRSEVTAASILSNAYIYAYDNIGNHTASSVNYVETVYDANNLNQYSQISVPFVPSVENPYYDADGNLLTNGVWSYTWDAENRLVTAYSNFACIVSNAYDHMSRRVLKVTPSKTHTFVYDGWNVIQETIQNQQSSITNHYVWGKDLSGSIQGAGGVGGLLAVSIVNAWYFPLYDNNGNIVAYADEAGILMEEYAYDAFGSIIHKIGNMAEEFAHRFSSKYYDHETNLYYYGHRFYDPVLHRWMNRDKIEENGGGNLYTFVFNAPILSFDILGNISVTQIPGIMTAKGWTVGASLMKHWLSLPQQSTVSPNTSIITMSWALGFARAKTVYDKIFSEHIYANIPAKTEIEARVRRTVPSLSGKFCDLTRSVVEVNKDYINQRSVGSLFDSIDDMFAALGRFNFRVAVSGNVTPKGSANACIRVDSVGVFIRDSYDFDGTQTLGYWNEKTNYAGKNFFKGDKVTNKSFRDYRAATGMGHDFEVFSDIKVTPLTEPFEFDVLK